MLKSEPKRSPGRPKGSTKKGEARSEELRIGIRGSVKSAYLKLPRGERVGIVEDAILAAAGKGQGRGF